MEQLWNCLSKASYRNFAPATFLLLCAMLAAQFCSTTASAQNDVGSVVGFVTDQSGAVIPNAQVTIANEGTGETRIVTTDAQGHYAVPNLAPAVYKMTAAAAGFSTEISLHNRLASNSTVEINARLTVGRQSETVQVTDTADVLQTQSAAIQSEVTATQVQKEELNGRNPIYMTQLLPGVVSSVTMGDLNFAFNSGSSFEVNGARGNDTRYIIDGASATRTRADSQIIAGANVDSVQEMQVLTGDYSAEYGGASGAQVRIITKSGTTNFHGSLYEYLRNSDMNANTWLRNENPATQFAPEFTYNNFGFSVGGPVWAPKVPVLHALRDKFFFFINEDWIRLRQAATQNMSVPTALMREGNFSELLNPNNPFYSGVTKIYDPLTCPKAGAATCQQFSYNGQPNDIPPNRLSANGIGILKSYPAPTPGFQVGSQNYAGSLPNPYNQRKGQINGDLLLTSAHHLEFRRSDDSFYELSPFNQSNPQVPIIFYRPNQTNGLGWVWTISPTIINEAHASVSIDDVYIDAAPNGAGYNRSAFGIDFNYILPGQKASENKIPTASVPTFSSISGGPYPSHSSGIIYAYSDSLTKVWGNHTIKGGFYATYAGENDNDQINVNTVPNGASNQNGTFQFTDARTGLGATSGVGLANVSLGLADAYAEIGPKAFTVWRGWTFEYFAQDSWQVTPKFNLNYGVRFTTAIPPHALWGNSTFFDPASYNASQAPQVSPTTGNVTLGTGNPYDGVVIPGISAFPSSATVNNRVPAANPSNNACDDAPCTGLFAPNLPKQYVNTTTQVQPRLGFAWQVHPRTVFRAGVGSFVTNKGLLDNIFPGGNSPFQPTVAVANVSVDNPGASVTTAVAPAITLTTLAKNLEPPTRWNWNVTIEHEIPKTSSTFQIAYVGARGYHNWNTVDINQPTVGALIANPGVNVTYLRPYKGFGTIYQEQSGVNSNYNALQTSWISHFRSGSSIGVSYTYSKSMDGGSNYRDIVPDSYNASNLWGPSEYDFRHVFVINYLYALPFFAGKRNLAGEALGGWQLSGNVEAQSGTPCGVGMSADYAGVGEYGSFGCGSEGQFWVKNGNPALPHEFAGPGNAGAQWFARTNFAQPVTGTINLQHGVRDDIYGPGLQNWNLALIKAFPITEGTSFEFRAEAYNFINHPYLAQIGQTGGLNFNPTSSQFGEVTAKGTSNPRNLQVGARIHF